jgi:glycosyltransferase involved in cell wall biosynthesis
VSLVLGLKKMWHVLPQAWRYGLAARTRHLSEPLLALALPKAKAVYDLPSSCVLVIGLFSSAIGHGSAANLLVLELEKDGIVYETCDVSRFIVAPADADTGEGIPSAIPHTTSAPTIILVLNPDIAVHVLTRLGPDILKHKRVIAYWVWELEVPPKSWRHLSHIVHEIWTPSQFSAMSLAKIFHKPIHVVPHPVALAETPPLTDAMRARARGAIGISETAFVALQSFSFASSLERKNAIGAITAFSRAFRPDEDACLVIRHLSSDIYPDALMRLQAAATRAGPQIRLIAAADCPLCIHDFYAMADVYISLHRSEGFGLNLAEAMRAGIPLIATGWSGNLDFMDATSAAMVPYHMDFIDDPDRIYNDHQAKWAYADLSVASDYLRDFFDQKGKHNPLCDRAQDMIDLKLSGGASARLLRRVSPPAENFDA